MSHELPHICFVALRAFPLLSGTEEVQLIGGAELQQVIVAKRLAAKGWRVSMICLDFGQPEKIEIDGVEVIRAYRQDAGLPVLRFLWPRLKVVWQCLKRADADIYYQRTAGMLTGVMAAYCKRHRKKSVFAAAGNPDLVPDTPRIRFARDRGIYSYGLRHVDRIFVQNDEQAQLCQIHLGREAIKVPNCYALPKRRTHGSQGKYILWVSTIRDLKRPELFLDLAAALPSLRFQMIGGPGRDALLLYDAMKARAHGLGNVEFRGFVPYKRVEEIFDEAQLFVNTSDSEGFPNTFLQAWARGIPTVSFVDSGARLEGKPVGIRVKSMDSMITAVADLTSSEPTRLLEGRRCELYFEKFHSIERIVDLYDEIFRDLATQSRIADSNR